MAWTPEHVYSGPVSTADDGGGVFKRGRSWNVNTEKGKAPPFILPGLCHASVFHSSFFSVFSHEAERRRNLKIVLWSFVVVACFVRPCTPSSPSDVFGQRFCDLHPNNDTSICFVLFFFRFVFVFFPAVQNSTAPSSPSGWDCWFLTSFVN